MHSFHDPKAEPVASLLDNEPAVVAGYTLTEFIFTTLLSLCVFPVIFGFIALFFGYFVIGVMLGIMVAALVIWLIGTKLARIKEGKPDGFYQLKVLLIINAILGARFVTHSGRWSQSRGR